MLTIKKLKLFQGMEGEGFNLDLYLDGKKIAFVMDDGHGGVYDYDFVSEAAAQQLADIVNAMPPTPAGDEEWAKKLYPDGLIPMNIDMVMDELINDHQHQKKLTKMRKTHILFTTPHCTEKDFMSVKQNGDIERYKALILKKHPDAVFI